MAAVKPPRRPSAGRIPVAPSRAERHHEHPAEWDARSLAESHVRVVGSYERMLARLLRDIDEQVLRPAERRRMEAIRAATDRG